MRPATRPLRDETLAQLRAALPPGGGSCTLAFAEEVVRQVAHTLCAAPADPARAEDAAAAEVSALVRESFEGAEAARAAARRLASEPATLAAFFQNLDLLEDCPRGHARAVAALVAATL